MLSIENQYNIKYDENANSILSLDHPHFMQ